MHTLDGNLFHWPTVVFCLLRLRSAPHFTERHGFSVPDPPPDPRHQHPRPQGGPTGLQDAEGSERSYPVHPVILSVPLSAGRNHGGRREDETPRKSHAPHPSFFALIAGRQTARLAARVEGDA